MYRLVELPSFVDQRGTLTVLEDFLLFPIKRVYWIYNSVQPRGGHRHVKCRQALIALNGRVEVTIKNSGESSTIILQKPSQALCLEPEAWHEMQLAEAAILLVCASQNYSQEDYIFRQN